MDRLAHSFKFNTRVQRKIGKIMEGKIILKTKTPENFADSHGFVGNDFVKSPAEAITLICDS